MKPAPFHYHAPSSLEEALRLLSDLGDDDAKVLAGGQSLMPMLNMRLARTNHLIDINGLRELDYVRDEQGGLAVGALTRHRAIERSPIVGHRLPLITEAMPQIGDRQIRFRGTLGGSMAHADPAAELPTIATALDAEMVIASQTGTRIVPASDFFLSFLTTAIEEHELLMEVRFPSLPAGAGCAFLELSRQLGTYAMVSAAAVVTVEDGHIADARLALGGVGDTPIRAHRAEAVLRNRAATPDVFIEAGRLAADETDPGGDVHASVEYRKQMAAVYARRALRTAADRSASLISPGEVASR
jgi:CO/xanthine dehydrogenase FAD-binding subunit